MPGMSFFCAAQLRNLLVLYVETLSINFWMGQGRKKNIGHGLWRRRWMDVTFVLGDSILQHANYDCGKCAKEGNEKIWWIAVFQTQLGFETMAIFKKQNPECWLHFLFCITVSGRLFCHSNILRALTFFLSNPRIGSSTSASCACVKHL